VHTHNIFERERVGVIFGLIANGGRPIMPHNHLGRVLWEHGLFELGRMEKIERMSNPLYDRKLFFLASTYEARTRTMDATHTIEQQQVSVKVFPSAGGITSNTY
jgi:hypothetical protein